MYFKFIANACGVFVGSQGTKLLMDPWLDDGVFEGSWCHYPPLKTKHSDLQGVDIIYLSHIHPDHYDERFFNYRRDIPIVILDSKYNFLENKLHQKGYTNIVKVKDWMNYNFRELSITLLSPFTKHVFHESEIGNLIDSGIVIKDVNGLQAFNANDNTPDLDSCKRLKGKFGQFDLAMINYNAAGPYPSCFKNLSSLQKKQAHDNILDRNIDHLINCCNVLQPRAILPFAGSYVLGGKEWKKNEFLGTTTWDRCATVIRERSDHNVVTMRENNILDLKQLKLDCEYIPIDSQSQSKYISQILSKQIYPYENDPTVSNKELIATLEKAHKELIRRMQKYKLSVTSTIIIKTEGLSFLVHKGDSVSSTQLIFYLDGRLLMRILRRKSQWNSAEIGCHIDIDREPNNYEVDAHLLMQFLHL